MTIILESILTMEDLECNEVMQHLDVVIDDNNGGENHIWQNITHALDDWLDRISNLEERQQQMSNLQEKVNRVLTQIQQDGLISIYDFGRLSYIGDVWINLLNLLSSTERKNDSTKRLIICNLLRLYEVRHISMDLFVETIFQLL